MRQPKEELAYDTGYSSYIRNSLKKHKAKDHGLAHQNQTDELIYKMNLGRFSRTNVKIVPSMKSRTKVSNIFPTYTELIGDCGLDLVECESARPCSGTNALDSLCKY